MYAQIRDMKVTRSLNAFTVWSQIERRKISRESPDLDDAEVSDLLQKRWKMISDKERPYFKETEMRELLQMLCYVMLWPALTWRGQE